MPGRRGECAGPWPELRPDSGNPMAAGCEGNSVPGAAGAEQDRYVVIEWDEEEKKLMQRECMQCSLKHHTLPCHYITVFSDPAHAHEIITKFLKVVEKSTDPSSGRDPSLCRGPPDAVVVGLVDVHRL